MKKLIFGLCFLMFLPFFLFSAGKVTIKGTIVGFDNNAMKLAQIHFRELSAKGYMAKEIKAGNDGKFEFEMEKTPVLNLSFTGTDHKQKDVQIFTLPEDKVIPLIVMLAPNNLDPSYSIVSVIGNFNDYDFESGIQMQKQPDGTFTAEIEKSGDTLMYQLLGPFTEPETRSVNGKQANFFVYDGGGDYRSVIVNKEKKVKITFNPKDYLVGTFEPIVSSPDKGVRELLDNQKMFSNHLKNINKAVGIYFQDQNREAFQSVLKNGLLIITTSINNSINDRVKRAAYFSYFEVCSNAIRLGEDSLVDKTLLSQILKQIPPNDEIWASKSQDLLTVVEALNNDEADKYADKVLEGLIGSAKNNLQSQIFARRLIKNYKLAGYVNSIIKDHSESTAWIVSSVLNLAARNHNTDAKKFFYEMLQKDFKDTKAASRAKREFAEDKAVDVGKQVPKFKLVSLDDNKTILTPESFKGKYVLIDIWATWCGPCVGEMGNIHKAYEKYKDKNFTILSISFDDVPDKVTKFREKKWKMPWNHAFAEGGFDSDIGKDFEVVGIPRPVLLDPNGKIIAMEGNLRGTTLDKTLGEILK